MAVYGLQECLQAVILSGQGCYIYNLWYIQLVIVSTPHILCLLPTGFMPVSQYCGVSLHRLSAFRPMGS